MHTLVLTTINLLTKFEMRSFTYSFKDMTGPHNFKMGHVTLTILI